MTGNPPLRRCTICGSPLNDPNRPWSENCGGDCLACMAEAGDPDCIAGLKEMLPGGCGACRHWGDETYIDFGAMDGRRICRNPNLKAGCTLAAGEIATTVDFVCGQFERRED